MSILMILKTCVIALNRVVTYGKDSCENLVNSISNLEALIRVIEEAENNNDASDK